LNLNTGHAYRRLREKRSESRSNNKPLDPLALAEGLSKYSEKGDAYIRMVSNIIRNYIPQDTDGLLRGEKKKE
jgi:Bax protein